MSECNLVSREGFLQLATHCRSIESLVLVHQFSVTDQVIQLFITNCTHLKLLDVSGCRLLTERAFHPWTDGSILLEQSPMEILNISGLEPDVSPAMVLYMLQHLPRITEICLGVAYERSDAVEVANALDGFHLDVGRCVTICRVSSSLQPHPSASFTTPF
ncbi:hypothetical protein BX666DRAFT_1854973 [Dichotomocladium elegans]|nr:hypothetical protein BX666DRAFT_1854973 [Dichotomocladium elegans]